MNENWNGDGARRRRRCSSVVGLCRQWPARGGNGYALLCAVVAFFCLTFTVIVIVVLVAGIVVLELFFIVLVVLSDGLKLGRSLSLLMPRVVYRIRIHKRSDEETPEQQLGGRGRVGGRNELAIFLLQSTSHVCA